MTRFRAGSLACGLVLALAGCGQPDEPPALRDIVPTAWMVEWQRGGSETDTIFQLPVRLATDGTLVYVLDRYASRIVALRADDGSVAWRTGRKGGGPGEFDAPEAVASLPGGGVAVADPNNRRITFLDADGTLDAAVEIPSGALVGSMCALDDGSLLLSVVVGEAPLVRIARDGRVIDRPALPWADLSGPATLRTQMVLGNAANGGCLAALGLGRGFAIYDGRRFGVAHDYVERFELPRVEVRDQPLRKSQRLGESTMAAISVAARGDTVAIAFMGRSRHAGRALDLYDGRAGGYLRTYLGPGIESLAVAGDRVFVLTRLNGYPAVLAQTIRPGE